MRDTIYTKELLTDREDGKNMYGKKGKIRYTGCENT
jgi:hypothetical protein